MKFEMLYYITKLCFYLNLWCYVLKYKLSFIKLKFQHNVWNWKKLNWEIWNFLSLIICKLKYIVPRHLKVLIGDQYVYSERREPNINFPVYYACIFSYFPIYMLSKDENDNFLYSYFGIYIV